MILKSIMEYDSRVKYPLNVNHNYDVLGKPNTKKYNIILRNKSFV